MPQHQRNHINVKGNQMSFRTIFCVTDVNDNDDALAKTIDLCEQTNSHLSVMVIAVTPAPAIYAYGSVPDHGWATDYAAGTAKVKQRGDAVERQLQKAGISGDVCTSYIDFSHVDDMIGERASYADVTLIGTTTGNEGELRDKTIYGALFYSNKPLLISPASGIQSFDVKKVMIAWDSGLPASAAINHALWQMKNADEVHIVMVDPVASAAVNGGEPGADLAQYLTRHGLKINVKQLASGGQSVAEVLKQHAIDMNADLIVMGGYGHSHLRQLIFGGVTSDFLKDTDIPVLMAH